MSTPDSKPFNYDLDEVFKFLEETVFHTELRADEHILTWAKPPQTSMGYPITEAKLETTLTRTTKPMTCYYSTATVTPDPKTGDLRNRKAQFCRLHVIVLDDIGTKVPAEKITLPPTYIIESSEGNYQYGYVLATPLDNLEMAEAIVHAIYTSGLTDGGGKLVGKLVRLPCGVNGKDGERGNFKVRLTKSDGPKYSPEELLSGLQINIEYKKLVKDTKNTIRDHLVANGIVTPWCTSPVEGSSLSGYIDPVLEWLYAREFVVQETDEWVEILCPWRHSHSSGGLTAGYSPAGWGANPTRRGFHCFHEHCSDKHTDEMLEWVVMQGGPFASIREHAMELVENYVLDPANEGGWKLSSTQPKFYSIRALNLRFPQQLKLPKEAGKTQVMASVPYWVRSANRVEIDQVVNDPRSEKRLYTDEEGVLTLNKFHRPTWVAAEMNPDDVKVFTDYLEYLIPADDEREYFTKWLACKVRDPAFRGAAILMACRAYGVGRDTLASMIIQLFGEHNCQKVKNDAIMGRDPYSEWQSKLLVFGSETLQASDKDFYQVYERIKESIDPAVSVVEINPKLRARYTAVCCSSVMLFSNHPETALCIPKHDRRFYVIANADVPAPPEYFVRIRAWMETNWVGSVWRWLYDKVDLSGFNGNAPPPLSRAKRVLTDGTQSLGDILVGALFARLPPVVSLREVNDVIAGRFAAAFDISSQQVAYMRKQVKDRVYHVDAVHRGRMRFSPSQTRELLGANIPPPTLRVVMSSDAQNQKLRAVQDDDLRITTAVKSQQLEVARNLWADVARDNGLARIADDIIMELREAGY